jgi:uncharacterized protein (DUF433 family)
MLEAKIIDRGRGPEIAGTRITVYDVLDYHKSGWHRDMIADTLELSSQEVEVAIRYIEEHRDEAKLDAMRGTARARLEEIRRSKGTGAADERNSRSGGQTN